MAGEPATAASSVDGLLQYAREDPDGKRPAALPCPPAEASGTVCHKPHPPLLLRLGCEVAGSQQQGHPHGRGGQHLPPQGLRPPGPGGTRARPRYFLCAPPCAAGLCSLQPAWCLWREPGLPPGTEALLEPLQATVWLGTRVLSSKSPCLGPTVTRKPVDGESSSSALWEIHSWDQGY